MDSGYYPQHPLQPDPHQHHTPPPRRKRWRRWHTAVSVFVAATLVGGLGAASLRHFKPANSDDPWDTVVQDGSPVPTELFADLPYDFNEPIEIGPLDPISIEFDSDIKVYDLALARTPADSGRPAFRELGRVYTDPLLENEIPASVSDSVTSRHWLHARPTHRKAEDFSDPTYAPVLTGWWEAQVLYFAQTVGPDGKDLDRPLVTPAVVTRPADELLMTPPKLTPTPAADGSVDFSWSRTQGANRYAVIASRVENYTANGITEPREMMPSADYRHDYQPLIDTDQLHGNSAEQSGELDEDGPFGRGQNDVFAAAPYSEDAIYGDQTLGSAYLPIQFQDGFTTEFNDSIMVAIVAWNTETGARSWPLWQDLESLLAELPVGIAGDAAWDRERAQCGTGFKSIKEQIECRTDLPVSMADGHTALFPVRFGSPTKDESSLVEMPYQAIGTRLDDTFTIFSYDAPDWEQQIKDALANLPKRSNATGRANLDYSELVKYDPEDLGKAVKTMPKVDYPVSGSSDAVKFIAANLIAGNIMMDISDYSQARALGIGDSVDEAVAQNPYIIYDSVNYEVAQWKGRYILVISYPSRLDLDERNKLQKDMAAKAKEVTGKIITKGMTDRDKASAINKWLVNNAEYDYDALAALEELSSFDSRFSTEAIDAWMKLDKDYPYNQNAYGVLVYGRGVCASYAAGFKLLADAAGLPAVYVSGVALESGQGHAWNRVQLDGKWWLVDSTWNEGADPQKWFAVPEDPKVRTADKDWMVDTAIPQYAAG
ncbi:MAG: hypothetical protein LBJ02_03030 [Bifidobacteriaceae bacterium]|jgi:transglutaminase-like putative cysteine protease|nr:hypothetical protein [Bifidobacteriaceae bacterium]